MMIKVATGIALAFMAAAAAAQAPAPAPAAKPSIDQRGLQCTPVDAAQIQKMNAAQRLGLYCGYDMAYSGASDAIEKAGGKVSQTDLQRQSRCSTAMNAVVDVMVKNQEVADCNRVSGFNPGAPKAP